MSPESEQYGSPMVAGSSRKTPGSGRSASSRGALGLLGAVVVMISLLGSAGTAGAASLANQPTTAVIEDGAGRSSDAVGGTPVGGDDRAPSSAPQAIGAQEPDDGDESDGKGRRKFVIGGVLVAVVIAVVVVVVLRRRDDDE